MYANEGYSRLTVRADRPLRIGLFTDTHYWPDGGDFYGGDGSLQLLRHSDLLLQTLVSEVNAAQVDLALHLGDVTCGGGTYPMSVPAFYAAQDSVRAQLHQLDAPIYALPGNHDCPPGGAPWTYFEEQWRLAAGRGWTIDTPHARLILLNAQGHTETQIAAARPEDPIYGWVSPGELDRLEAALASAADRPVLLFLHQLLKPWSGDRPYAAYYPVNNAEAVLDLLARYGNVRAVFQGHAHRLDVQHLPVGGHSTCFVVTPAIIQYPMAWLALTLNADTLHVQMRSLPLPRLADAACASGDGQTWRAGEPAWRDFAIALQSVDGSM